MIVDVNRIICRLCTGLYQNSIRSLYYSECKGTFCPVPYGAAIFALESGCDITSNLQCQIDNLSTTSITPGSGDETISCSISITSNTSTSPCIQPLLTRRI